MSITEQEILLRCVEYHEIFYDKILSLLRIHNSRRNVATNGRCADH